jgi:putative transposase
MPYHVLNRAVGRMRLFRSDGDFEAFERVMAEALRREPIPVLSFCVMPNHWHFLVRPERDGQLTAFFRWLTHTHAMRWRVAHRAVGLGPVYQGRFKSFPVQDDAHLLTVARYVERNALTAGLVPRAEQWRWGSLYSRSCGDASARSLVSPWPGGLPADWSERVNAPLSAKDRDRLRVSVVRGRPYGEDGWVDRTARELGLGHTVRPEGRPPRSKDPIQTGTESR